MSSKSKSMGIFSLMVAGMAQQAGYYDGQSPKTVRDADDSPRLSGMSEDEKKIKQGLKKFVYFGGTEIWAINQKTADKKYKKLTGNE